MTDGDGQEVRYRGLKLGGLVLGALLSVPSALISGRLLTDILRAVAAGDSMAGHALELLIMGAVLTAGGALGVGGAIYIFGATHALMRNPRPGTQEQVAYTTLACWVLCLYLDVLALTGWIVRRIAS